MMPWKPTEVPLTSDDRSAIDSALDAGLEVLGLSAEAAPVQMQEAIDRLLDSSRKKRAALKMLGEDLGFALGAVWGNAVVKAFRWQWVRLEDGDWVGLAITDSRRRFLALPFSYLTFVVDNDYKNVNLPPLQLWNCIKDRNLPEAEDQLYVCISEEELI